MQSFEAIYRTYAQDVYRYALKLTGDPYMAEDITSETFLRAMEHLDRYRGEAQLRVWLCQIAKNLYLTYLRTVHRSSEAAVHEIPDPVSVEDELIAIDQAEQIHAKLRALKDPYGQVFRLRHFEALSYREIGDLFGHTANWACVTYHRARAMVREDMEDHHD